MSRKPKWLARSVRYCAVSQSGCALFWSYTSQPFAQCCLKPAKCLLFPQGWSCFLFSVRLSWLLLGLNRSFERFLSDSCQASINPSVIRQKCCEAIGLISEDSLYYKFSSDKTCSINLQRDAPPRSDPFRSVLVLIHEWSVLILIFILIDHFFNPTP